MRAGKFRTGEHALSRSYPEPRFAAGIFASIKTVRIRDHDIMINTFRSATTTAANTTVVGILETAALVCSVDLILATSLIVVHLLQAQTQMILNASASVTANV
ncbi:hypothetical protein FBULB1_9559 [Fusarium bulbicola]|nr:hypothetical protein FBULB1_9559 [Fusarium bulbicola]